MGCLSNTHGALSPIISPSEIGLGAHASNPSNEEVETGGLGIQSHYQLYSEFESSLGYKKPCGWIRGVKRMLTLPLDSLIQIHLSYSVYFFFSCPVPTT